MQPGWYPDPVMPQTQRYWDGWRWTEHAAPAPSDSSNSQALVVGGFVMALLIPIIGFLIGLVVAFRDGAMGLAIIILSLFGGWLWIGILQM